MQTEEGREVQVHERAHFADEVRQPILSFGRLLEAGWGIDGQEKRSQVKIPSETQRKSLIVQAKIRKVEALPCFVRALDAVEVKLGNGLEEIVKPQAGWKKYGNKWIGTHLSTNHQTPLGVSGIDQEIAWDRTT